MNLTIIGHDDRYSVEQLMLSLFSQDTEGRALSRLTRGKVWLTAVSEVEIAGKKTRAVRRLKAKDESVRLRRRILQQSFYLAALPHLESAPAWGALAGVRPTKISTKHLLAGGSEKSADKLLKEVYFVSPQRRKLAIACSESTVKAAEKMEKNDISLYVGIPFCPTRCAYCSFVSQTIGRDGSLLEDYLKALYKELAYTGKLLEKSGKTIRTVYIGGGTPTTLSASQMAELLDAIHNSFDLSRCIEFTVEGGRPDTLDAEKLQVIRAHGADRMSINPQTMQDAILKACGRPHTGADVLRRYAEAKKAGFDEINMDLIAGLPEDTFEGFKRSLDQVAALNPANITVHTLALKKGADLFEKRANLPSYEEVAKMVDYATKTLYLLGYKPYYLYRQKYMSGSFENVGWARDGLDCLYNIYMMEELHTIVSLGGGGMTKINLPGGKLQRFHNPKFPEEYISQIDTVLQQKQALVEWLKGSV